MVSPSQLACIAKAAAKAGNDVSNWVRAVLVERAEWDPILDIPEQERRKNALGI